MRFLITRSIAGKRLESAQDCPGPVNCSLARPAGKAEALGSPSRATPVWSFPCFSLSQQRPSASSSAGNKARDPDISLFGMQVQKRGQETGKWQECKPEDALSAGRYFSDHQSQVTKRQEFSSDGNRKSHYSRPKGQRLRGDEMEEEDKRVLGKEGRLVKHLLGAMN